MIKIKPEIENDLCIIDIQLKDVNIFYDKLYSYILKDAYINLKDTLFKNRNINNPSLLSKFEDKLSCKNSKNLKDNSGTIYPHITEEDNLTTLEDIHSNILEILNNKHNTTRMVVRNLPNFNIYKNSITDNSIDVPCATQFQYLKDRFIVNFRAHALKSEFLADLYLIYKYYFLPVYKNKQNITYQIICNTTQEIEYLNSQELEKILEVAYGIEY